MARYITSLIVLLVCACAPISGAKLAQPINAALGSITTNAQSVLKSGAAPQDTRVQTIVKQAAVAQKSLSTMTTEYTKVVTTVAAKDHRIFIDDCIFGAVAMAVLIPIGIKLLPFLMAL